MICVSVACACEATTPEQPASIPDNGSTQSLTQLVNFDAAGNRLTRFDVAGNAIDLHGGEIQLIDGTYYWYGEHYSCGFQWITPGAPFCGFRSYSSPDLVHWTDRGLLFELSAQWLFQCSGASNGCFRPHVARNAANRNYVLWINAYSAEDGYFVYQSASPTGPFTEVTSPKLSVGQRPYRGDSNLFVDDDGKAYLVNTQFPAGDLVVEELASNYQTGTGRYVQLGLTNVESPSVFKRNGRYYVTFSDPNCGFCATGTSYMTAQTPLGPWSGRQKISTNSCGGQPTHVSALPAKGGGTWYLYQSDLWNNGEVNEATADQFWGVLAFDANGQILSIDCAKSQFAPVTVTTIAPNGDLAERFRLVCDIGSRPGATQREVRLRPATGGSAAVVSLNVYKRGSRNSPEGATPDAPLVVELYSLEQSAQLVARTSIDAAAIQWSAQMSRVTFNAPIRAGVEYSVRLSTAATRGCYGVPYRDDLGAPVFRSFVSTDQGLTWTAETNRTIKFGLGLQ